MSSKKRGKGDEINKVREQMEDSMSELLNDDSLLDDNTDVENELPAVVPKRTSNYVAMKTEAEEKAKKTISSLMKFYLDEDIIEQDEYIKAKKKIDEMTFASLIFQLQTAEKTLVTLMETIDGGELAPRMFEVLATLQKSMLDIIKSQTMYLMAAEEGTKKIARDAEVYKGLKNKQISNAGATQGTSNLNRGSKDLMKTIQTEIKGDTIKDEVEEAKVEPIEVVNITEIPIARDIEETDDVDEDIDDELNNISTEE